MHIVAQHLDMLAASGITREYALARGYETILDPRRLADLKITPKGRNVPGLLVPMLRVDGSTWGYQYRPDVPRLRDGRPIKYETPYQQPNGLDIPPGVADKLGDPNVPLWVTEGCKKADCGAIHGLCIVGLSGVWNWLTTSSAGGKMALPEWRDCALNGRRVVVAFDGDVARKEPVQKAARGLAGYLATKGARIEYLHLPDTDDKTGLDDYLQEHTVEELYRLVKPTLPPVTQPRDDAHADRQAADPKPGPVKPISLDECHAVFRCWLGDDYDTDALDAMLAAVAVERLDGDPLWLLIVSGSGAAKTETVQACHGIGAIVISDIASEAALLSGTPAKERATDATGGLLRQVGERGVLIIKDVTSILSMDRNIRGRVIAALREIHDGAWGRDVGTDGGRSIRWKGRIAIIGAVTTAWDTHQTVVSAMGDRFVLIRIDSTANRLAAGRMAIDNTGGEAHMRHMLANAVSGVIAQMSPDPITVTDDETDALLAAADLVTLARTAVEYDYRGNVADAHAPEMPTRFAKQLTQIVRGAVAIGMGRADALRLAIRCARDSMPPLRLAIIDDLAGSPHSTPTDVRRRINKPWTTVDRQLQALHMLGVTDVEECDIPGPFGKIQTRWYYSLAAGISPTALVVPTPEKLLPSSRPLKKREKREERVSLYAPTNLSGDSTGSANGTVDEPVTTVGHWRPPPIPAALVEHRDQHPVSAP